MAASLKIANTAQERKLVGMVKDLPNPSSVDVVNNTNGQTFNCRVIHVTRRDSFIVEICVYFYGAKALFEWDQTTCSYRFTSDFVIVKPYTA